MAYILPQVQVFQEFSVAPSTVVRNLNAFVFGPNYQLFRYSIATEKALIDIGTYDNDLDTAYSYPSQPAGSTVDTDYVALYMEHVWAEYLSISAGISNPLNMVGANERNKLRAAPVLDAPENGEATHAQFGADSLGYFTGGVDLPEYYYFWPVGGADVSGDWDATDYTSDLATESARLTYSSSEDVSGVMDIDKANTPLTALVFTAGPDGMQVDLDAGSGDGVMRQPKVITFGDGAHTFTVQMKVSSNSIMRAAIDAMIDDSLNTIVNIDAGAVGVALSWTPATRVLLVESAGVQTLAALRATMVADSDVAANFTIGTLTGAGSAAWATAVDEASVNVATGLDVALLSNGFRTRVLKNPYVFKTGNGIDRTSQFKTRDVQVGDRVRYSVVDSLAVTHTGTTKVVGFEADQTLAVTAAAANKSTNQATQAVNDLTTGLAIIAAGTDNQRDMDGVNTKLFGLSSAIKQYPGDMLNGLVGDTFDVEITVAGAAGTARANVVNDSGTYVRANVLIEATGADDGQLYIGANMYVNFDTGSGDPDALFKVADTYTFSTDVLAAFTALTSTEVVSAGTYTGLSDTTYLLEVLRGGVFDRAVTAMAGLTTTTGATLTPAVDWTAWSGGDVNDEYVLRCTTGGLLATAIFTLESQQGDTQTSVRFLSGVGTDVALGGRGLTADFTEAAGPLTYAAGDYWVIRLNGARPLVRVSDSAGIDSGASVVVADATSFTVGILGVSVTFAVNVNTEGGFATNGGLRLGDVYQIAATAVTDGALRTLVLADDLPAAVTPGLTTLDVANPTPSNFSIWLYLVQTATEIGTKKLQSAPDYNWVAAASAVTVNSAIAVQDATWAELDGSLPYLPVYTADMYLEYRALVTTHTGAIDSISDISDVVTTFGVVHTDNPLSLGVFNALSNSGNRAVYYMGVATDDLAGFSTVLDAATLTDVVYGLAPLSQDTTILTAVEAHVNAMSSETTKRWRIAFVGTDMETVDDVYTLATNPGSTEFYALVSDNPTAVGTQYTLVNFVDALGVPSVYTECLTDVVAGDQIRINYATDAWGSPTYQTYLVASVLTNTSLLLTTGLAAAVTIPSKVEVHHPMSVAEIATRVAATSAGFANRRVYHVFPDALNSGTLTETSEFAAAAVAGLCSSVIPQQGLTNIELNGFDDIPAVYSTFSLTQLNEMAESGTMIIMQDVEGGRIYIRHQVSTASLADNINTKELSVTKNLDSISYYFANRLASYIGRYNITPELLEILRTQIQDGLNFLGSQTNVGLIGPQLLFDTNTGTSEVLSVSVHPSLLDHVIIRVNLRLPYPLNVIELHLVV